METQYLADISNIVLPLAIGAIIYATVNPHIYAYRLLFGDNIEGVYYDNNSTPIVLLIRCYAADMLWAYSFSFYLQFANSGCPRKKSSALLFLCIVIIILLEIIQLLPSLYMTFDVWDIFVEIFAATVAYFVFNSLHRRCLL